MPYPTCKRFKKSALAATIAAAMLPVGVSALDFADGPPSTVSYGLAPNVIVSLDDSGSMAFQDIPTATGGPPMERYRVLQKAISATFSNKNLLPDGSIRLTWQTMHDKSGSLASSLVETIKDPSKLNAIRVLDEAQRQRFLDYINTQYRPDGDTPTHELMRQADAYLREPLNIHGPWASEVGTTRAQATYLGCRRNFHIVFTDGGWTDVSGGGAWGLSNGVKTGNPVGNYDGESHLLPDKIHYYDVTSPNTYIYRDRWNYTSISDWALYSWANQLQDPNNLTGKLEPSSDYQNAAATETFTSKTTNHKATLEKYWNPRYDPATWPHLVTYTIGFSEDALPSKNFDATTKGLAAFLSSDRSKSRFLADAVSNITPPSSLLPYGFDGDFADYANGTYIWRALAILSDTDPSAQTPKPAVLSGNNSNGSYSYASGETQVDMWHAAINGRGRFYQVQKDTDLDAAFRSILQDIRNRAEANWGDRVASGDNASRSQVGIYLTGYDPRLHWKGWVSALSFGGANANSNSTSQLWGGKSSADLLDELNATPGGINNRLILTWSETDDATTISGEKGGVPFRWVNDDSLLSTIQKSHLDERTDGSRDGRGAERLLYIRGDKSQENNNLSEPFRQRSSIQGSSVNSNLWYVANPDSNYALPGYQDFARDHRGRLPMIYIGADDGMLHGFSATDGTEKIAYVPRGLIAKLNLLTDPSFDDHHRYFVDGSPMTGDVDLGSGKPDWRTVLVGTLGAGGKGYFVLDITNPGGTLGSTSTAPIFSEKNANQLVLLDKTRYTKRRTPDLNVCANNEACLAKADIGHIFDKPILDESNSHRATQITRLNNNRWAVLLGNGYNSKGERPVLLIQYLDGDKKLLRLVATGNTPTGSINTTDNGLSAPRPVDINGDGRPDVVYAGDLQGNMWKFLLTDSDDSKWGPAKWGSQAADATTNHDTVGVPLFSAKNAAGVAQPITIAPSVRANNRNKTITTQVKGQNVTSVAPVGGLMVAFGTGRNVTKDDPQNTDVQSLYSILDNTRYKRVATDRVDVCDTFPVPAGDECAMLVKSSADLPQAVLKTNLLLQRQINPKPTQVAATTKRDSREFWKLDATNAQTQIAWGTQQGWYMDLPVSGERILKPLSFYDNSNILAAYSQVPSFSAHASGSSQSAAQESCEPADINPEKQYLNLINIQDGNPASMPLMDVDGNGVYDKADSGAFRMAVSGGGQTMVKRGKTIINTGKERNGAERSDEMAAMPVTFIQPSWHQLR